MTGAASAGAGSGRPAGTAAGLSRSLSASTSSSIVRLNSWEALRNSASILPAVVLLASVARADVPVVELDGIVHAVTAAHVQAGIAEAARTGAPLVVVRVDTPGGLDTSMRQIVDAILRSEVPVAVFVGPSGARA